MHILLVYNHRLWPNHRYGLPDVTVRAAKKLLVDHQTRWRRRHKRNMWSKKDDILLSSNTDGSEDEETYVDKDSEVVDEDDAGKIKRRTDVYDNLDIEDESSDSDMADTFTKECRKRNELVAKRWSQEVAADPSHNKEENISWKGRKESNCPAQDGAAGPSSDKDVGSWKRRIESNRRAQKGAADPSIDKEDGSRKRRMERNRRAQDGAADPSSNNDNIIRTVSTPPWARNNGRRNKRLNAESEIPTAEKNVRQRITIFVKNTLFRKIKFIASQAAFTRAFERCYWWRHQRILWRFSWRVTNVSPRHWTRKGVHVNKPVPTLQGKQSKDFKNRGEDFFTLKDVCKLSNVRQGETSVLLVLQCLLGMRMWGENLENCEINTACFGGTRQTDQTSDNL